MIVKGYSWLGGVLLSLFAVMQQAVAEDASPALKCVNDCVPVGQWQFNLALGAGLRQNPLLHKSDTPLILLPEVSYYGERFFLKNLEFGFTLFESTRHQLHLLGTPSIDQMYFNRWDPLNFTDSAGFASSHTLAAPPTPVAQSPRAYSVTLNGAVLAAPGGGAGAAPPPPASNEGFENGGTSSSSSSSVSNINDSDWGDGGVLSAGIRINGAQLVSSSASIVGREGNIITVNQLDGGTLAIDGLSERDVLQLNGESFVFTEAVGSEQVVYLDNLSLRANTVSSEPPEVVHQPTADETVIQEIRRRRVAGLAGLEYLYSGSRVNLHLQALTDVTSVHHGQELRLAMIFPWQYHNHRWAATLGANYQSYEVLDYYYGLGETEVAHPLYVYQIDRGGWSQMLRLDWQMALSRRWSLRAMAQYKHLNSDVRRSPLVSESGVGSVFIGGVYHF